MMRAWLLSGMLLMGVLAAPGIMAQTVNLDMDLSNNDPDLVVDPSVEVSAGQTFDVYLVVQGAVDMTGVSVDITFQATDGLSLVAVQEVPGDLDFSGDLDISAEVLAAINEFIEEFNDSNRSLADFVDGYDRSSGVVLDADGDNRLDISEELLPVIDEFIAQFNSENIEYWTRLVLLGPSDFDESVEIFDPPAKSNEGGANPGLIDDITTVLLKRPDRTEAFGFSGDAIVAKITFRADAAGQYSFDFPQAVWIDNTFQGISDIQDLDLPSPLPSVTVQ